MDNHSKRSIPHKNKVKRKKSYNKKLILVITAVIILIVSVCVIILLKAFKKNQPVPDFTTTAEFTTQAESTVSETQLTTAEQLDKNMYVIASTLNVRKEPSVESEIIAKLPKGSKIKVTGIYNNDWYIVEVNGIKGYCSPKYLTASLEPETDIQTNTPYLIKVNRIQNAIIIYSKAESGEYSVAAKAMICSVGVNNTTPTGTYSTTDKYTWRLLSGGVYGQYATRITGKILFHSVPYFSQNKADLEYEEYNKLGQAASLGCVRLSVIDAKWIYDNCPKGTPVVIYDSDSAEPLPRPDAIKIDTSNSNKCWDPTDPDSNNPWNY